MIARAHDPRNQGLRDGYVRARWYSVAGTRTIPIHVTRAQKNNASDDVPGANDRWTISPRSQMMKASMTRNADWFADRPGSGRERMHRGTSSRRGRRGAAARRARERTQPEPRRSFRHNLEYAALDEERIVVQVMLDSAHLDDAEIAAHGRAHADVDLAHAQVDDRVGEELFDPEVGEGRRVPPHLGDEEGRRVQVPQFLKELEDLVPGALERCEGVEGVEAVQRDEVAAHLLLVPGELSAQAQEPSGLLADLLDLASQRPHVDDVDALRVAEIHPERGHLRDERGAALLHRQVQPGGPVLLRLVEEDAVDERRLQGPRRSCDEDDVSPRDAAAQTIVQANDIRRNLVCGLRQDGTPSRPDRRYPGKVPRR